MNTEARTREASRLRLLATGHMTSHKSYFEPWWAPGPDEDAQVRNHQSVPQDFSDYILAASNRGYYADDLLLTALAARLATPIIVFAWSSDREVWERTVVANRFFEGSAEVGKKSLRPLILMQSNKHYRALRPINKDTEVPVAWLQETEAKDKKFFRGGGSKSIARKVSLPSSRAPSVRGQSALSLLSIRPSNPASRNALTYLPSLPLAGPCCLCHRSLRVCRLRANGPGPLLSLLLGRVVRLANVPRGPWRPLALKPMLTLRIFRKRRLTSKQIPRTASDSSGGNVTSLVVVSWFGDVPACTTTRHGVGITSATHMGLNSRTFPGLPAPWLPVRAIKSTRN